MNVQLGLSSSTSWLSDNQSSSQKSNPLLGDKKLFNKESDPSPSLSTRVITKKGEGSLCQINQSAEPGDPALVLNKKILTAKQQIKLEINLIENLKIKFNNFLNTIDRKYISSVYETAVNVCIFKNNIKKNDPLMNLWVENLESNLKQFARRSWSEKTGIEVCQFERGDFVNFSNGKGPSISIDRFFYLGDEHEPESSEIVDRVHWVANGYQTRRNQNNERSSLPEKYKLPEKGLVHVWATGESLHRFAESSIALKNQHEQKIVDCMAHSPPKKLSSYHDTVLDFLEDFCTDLEYFKAKREEWTKIHNAEKERLIALIC